MCSYKNKMGLKALSDGNPYWCVDPSELWGDFILFLVYVFKLHQIILCFRNYVCVLVIIVFLNRDCGSKLHIIVILKPTREIRLENISNIQTRRFFKNIFFLSKLWNSKQNSLDVFTLVYNFKTELLQYHLQFQRWKASK